MHQYLLNECWEGVAQVDLGQSVNIPCLDVIVVVPAPSTLFPFVLDMMIYRVRLFAPVVQRAPTALA